MAAQMIELQSKHLDEKKQMVSEHGYQRIQLELQHETPTMQVMNWQGTPSLEQSRATGTEQAFKWRESSARSPEPQYGYKSQQSTDSGATYKLHHSPNADNPEPSQVDR